MPPIFSLSPIPINKNFDREVDIEMDKLNKKQPSNYLDGKLRDAHIISCDKHLFYSNAGARLNGRYLYIREWVSGQAKNVLVFFESKYTSHKQHHSYLNYGKPVSSAGYLEFVDGKLMLISNESGHYKPTNDKMFYDINYFLGLTNNPALIFEDHSHYPTQKKIYRYLASEFLIQGENAPSSIIDAKDQTSNFGKSLDVYQLINEKPSHSSFFNLSTSPTHHAFFKPNLLTKGPPTPDRASHSTRLFSTNGYAFEPDECLIRNRQK